MAGNGFGALVRCAAAGATTDPFKVPDFDVATCGYTNNNSSGGHGHSGGGGKSPNNAVQLGVISTFARALDQKLDHVLTLLDAGSASAPLAPSNPALAALTMNPNTINVAPVAASALASLLRGSSAVPLLGGSPASGAVGTAVAVGSAGVPNATPAAAKKKKKKKKKAPTSTTNVPHVIPYKQQQTIGHASADATALSATAPSAVANAGVSKTPVSVASNAFHRLPSMSAPPSMKRPRTDDNEIDLTKMVDEGDIPCVDSVKSRLGDRGSPTYDSFTSWLEEGGAGGRFRDLVPSGNCAFKSLLRWLHWHHMSITDLDALIAQWNVKDIA